MLTQPELAEKIRRGYAKHSLKVTNKFYHAIKQHAACPIFAAYAEDFDSLQAADDLKNGSFDLSLAMPYTSGIAKAINADYALIQAISDLFDRAKVTDLDEVLAKLDNNAFEYPAT